MYPYSANYRWLYSCRFAGEKLLPFGLLVHCSKGSVLFSFAITAAGVVQCGGPKRSPRTSSIVQIIFSFWSFEISEGILRNQKNYYRFRFIF